MMFSLVHKIQKSVFENASRVAIIHDDQTYTYQDLEIQSNKFANYLSSYGVKKGSNVAFLLRRSFDTLAAILAIWKQGAAYIPLDPNTPKIRIEHILNNLQPSCIVSEPALLNKVLSQHASVLTLKDLDFMKSEEVYPSFEDNQALLAYIIYTSGSTGEPKGVMLTHANVTNHVLWLIQDFGFSSQDCFSFNSSMAFDFTVATTIIPLAVGAKILITSEEDTLEIETYCQQLVKNRVTFAKWTPSYFKLLVDYVEHHRPDLSSFRYIMLAGEELLRSYVERWLAVYPMHTLVNEYGPTETAVGITTHTLTKESLDQNLYTVPIGKPAINSIFYVVDQDNKLVEEGQIGELLIGGKSVANGYYQQPTLTAERFVEDPFSKNKEILYRTGDLVKKLPDGAYLYISRIDNQVKVDGYRIELNEIEHWILQYPGVDHAKVIVEKNLHNTHIIVAYLVSKNNTSDNFDELRSYLLKRIPHYMLPTSYVLVSHIPCNRNGKVDVNALKEIATALTRQSKTFLSSNIYVKLIIESIEKQLNVESYDLNASFFSMGVTSLQAAQIITDINQQEGGVTLKIHDLFTYPTISSLAAYMGKQEKFYSHFKEEDQKNAIQCEPIAIIAMDCRLPGADNCEMLWQLCRDGKETIKFFKPNKNDQISALDKKHTVYAKGMLNDIEYFDANFFNFSPKEAHLSDPQHRLLIESAWVVLEKAGYIPNPDDLFKIGVYVSMNDSTYILNHNLVKLLQPLFNDRFAMQRLMSPQCLATKIAYLLNCTGPSMTTQAACSSSLVSVVLACQQLASHHCNLALAGGVSLVTPQESPYLYQQGNIFSPDGHCKPFDANAEGTVFSNGLGMVVLKRLTDALKDNDTIISVIRGYSTNNDGSNKMSYTAPSVQGQMSCVLSALKTATIDVDSIQYIETHGTGTLIGDPIEIEALTKAFQLTSNKRNNCALGSIKANIGHTHVAAGVAGLIKTSLVLQNKLIPPLIHFKSPNPHIDWDHSPFYVNTRLQYWERKQSPRRAAVSAFGVGGTNAHVIVEEAPEHKSAPSHKTHHLLLLSAKTQASLSTMHTDLIHYLKTQNVSKDEHSFLADIAYTLQQGRRKFQYQSGVICESVADAIASLENNRDPNDAYVAQNLINKANIVFLFPGKGTPVYENLSLALYQEEPTYKTYLDASLSIASAYVGCNLESILFPSSKDGHSAGLRIENAEFAHPILFSIEYALAKLLMEWGIHPDFIMGCNAGEYVAACISGVFSLENALKLSCIREKFILTSDSLDEASGKELLDSYTKVLQIIDSHHFDIPCLSSLTGQWMSEQEVFSEEYWIKHLSLDSVERRQCANQLIQIPNTIFLEVGPGETLSSSIQRCTKNTLNTFKVLPAQNGKNTLIAEALRAMWYHNVPINWKYYYQHETRGRIALPTYPFQKNRYWFDQIISSDANHAKSVALPSLYAPTWVRNVEKMTPTCLASSRLNEAVWILFDNHSELSQCSLAYLKSNHCSVVVIQKGTEYEQLTANYFVINPTNKEQYHQLLLKIVNKNINHYAVMHFWSMDKHDDLNYQSNLDSPILFDGLYSGVFLIQAFQKIKPAAVLSTGMVTTQLHMVTGDELTEPLKSSVLSLCRVLSLENKNHRFNAIDIEAIEPSNLLRYSTNIIQTVMKYLYQQNIEAPSITAYRNLYCWKLIYQPIETKEKTAEFKLSSPGIYFITGGLGAMGLTIANWLSKQQPVKLLLLSKTPFPQQDEWDKYLCESDLDDGIREKIQILKQITSQGTSIIIATGDIANYIQMKGLIEKTVALHGEIKGVFHLAGVSGEGIAMLKDRSSMCAVMSPKIQGIRVLSQLFNHKKLDFMVCASSLTAVAGGVGQLDYCAANLFLDYFMSQNFFEQCNRLLTINWNSWSSIGMAAFVKSSKTHEKLYLENSVTPEQAMILLEAALNADHRQIIVSHVAPEEERKRIIQAFEKSAIGEKKLSIPTIEKKHAWSTHDIVKHIWQDLLGVAEVHENDTFYSLGGDSLIAIQLLEALESQFRINLTLQELAHFHTAHTLAKLIETRPMHVPDAILPILNNTASQIDKDSPVFFIHPLGGSVLCYFPLVHYLTTDRSYYAIQDPEIAKGELLFLSIQDMAKYYADEIYTKQKADEIILIGASYGGNVAIEMIPYLHDMKISVKKIILIDSWANINQIKIYSEDSLANECSESLKIIRDYYGSESANYQYIKKRLLWLRSYKPSKTSVEIVLLAAKELLTFYQKIACENNGWTPFSDRTIVKYTIDGTHDTMLQSKHLPALGKCLNKLLYL